MGKFVLKRDFLKLPPQKLPPQNTSMVRVSLIFVVAALFCLYFSDVSITTLDPWLEIDRMISGVFTPDFLLSVRLVMHFSKLFHLRLLVFPWAQLPASYWLKYFI